MEEQIVQLEQSMWNAVLHQDIHAFQKLVSPDAVMICGGYRCLGAEYASLLPEFRISSYNILKYEVIHSGPAEVLLHCVVRVNAADETAKDLEGLFHVASLWKRCGEEWHLTFNMDSRIIES